MSDYLKEPWMEQGGSIRTVRVYNRKSEADVKYKAPAWIAFNVGREVALHIVKVHNDNLGIKE